MTKTLATIVKGLSRRSVLVAAVAVASVASVGGISYALTANTQSAPAASAAPAPTTASPLAASTGAKAGLKGRIGRVLRQAVHIEVVLPATGGGFRTFDADRGTVTALSTTSITITPADGGAPVTDAITTTTRQAKVPVSVGQEVLLVSSGGDAVLIRHSKAAGSSAAGSALSSI